MSQRYHVNIDFFSSSLHFFALLMWDDEMASEHQPWPLALRQHLPPTQADLVRCPLCDYYSISKVKTSCNKN